MGCCMTCGNPYNANLPALGHSGWCKRGKDQQRWLRRELSPDETYYECIIIYHRITGEPFAVHKSHVHLWIEDGWWLSEPPVRD